MLSHCLVPSITKTFFAHWFWDSNHLQPFKYKIFNKVLQLLETFLFQNMSIVMPKKYKKKTGTNFDLITDFLIEKY